MAPFDYEVRVDISIRNYQGGGGDLRLSEAVTIPHCTFKDMARILEGFHELAQAVQAAKANAED